MKKFVVTAVFFAVMAGSSTQAASFNCRYAKLPVEVAICQSRELNRLDEIMARKYYRLKRRLGGNDWRELRSEQRRWQRRRNRCGYDRYCIEDSYVYRIRALNHWLFDR